MAFYGQFVVNEFATPYELKNWPDTQPPNGMGFLAGIEKTHSFGESGALKDWGAVFYGEAVYTDPYLYVNNSPFAAFINMRRLSLAPNRQRYSWIGYPEGRDAIVFALGARFFRDRVLRDDDLLELGCEVSYTRHGEHSLVWDWNKGRPYNQEKTPTGVSEDTFTTMLNAKWKPVAHLGLQCGVAMTTINNAEHTKGTRQTGAELSFGMEVRY
jgi:hypothetical protein